MTDTQSAEPVAASSAGEVWLEELRTFIVDFEGGFTRRLESLAASVPDDHTVFAGLRALASASRTPGPVPVTGAVSGPFVERARSTAPLVGEAVAKLLGAIATRADELLAAGVNDPDGTIIRTADFPNVYRLGTSVLVADISGGLPADHPAAGIAPHRTAWGEVTQAARLSEPRGAVGVAPIPPNTPLLVLGREPARWFWRASVATNTAQWREEAERREEERKRNGEMELAENRRRFDASPEGQRQKMEKLAAEVARLQRGTVGG